MGGLKFKGCTVLTTNRDQSICQVRGDYTHVELGKKLADRFIEMGLAEEIVTPPQGPQRKRRAPKSNKMKKPGENKNG